jgi:hypothetical protein
MSEVTSIQAAKTYNGNIISHGGKPENVKLKKILQNTPNEGTPLTVTYPKGTNTSINPGKSLILGINDSKPLPTIVFRVSLKPIFGYLL